MNERTTVHGPYDTDSEAMRDAAHVHQAYRVAYERGLMDRINEGMLLGALREAGVELGPYDRRIVGWLADWEPHVVQVVLGWIERAHADQARDADDASLLDAEAAVEGFPWRVYGLPRRGDRGRPWLVNAFTTERGAKDFAAKHPEHGPLTVTYAGEDAPETTAAAEPEVTHHAVMRYGIGGPACGTGRPWESMTRDTRAVTCPDCLDTLTAPNGGA